MSDLETVQTADLLVELRGRFPHCVFIGREEKSANGKMQMSFRHCFAGDLDTCVGLSFRIAHMISEMMMASMKPVPLDPTGGNTEEDSWGGSGNEPG